MNDRQQAERLLAEAAQLGANRFTRNAPSEKRGRGAAALLSEIEVGLDKLRALGYRERPDGSWVAPDGRIIRRR